MRLGSPDSRDPPALGRRGGLAEAARGCCRRRTFLCNAATPKRVDAAPLSNLQDAWKEFKIRRKEIKTSRNKIKVRRNEIQIRRNEIQISLPSINQAFSMVYRRLRPAGPAKPARRPFAAARTDSEHRAHPFVKKMSISEESHPRRSRPPHPAFRLASRQAHERTSAQRQWRIRSDGGNGDPEPGQWASLNFGFRPPLRPFPIDTWYGRNARRSGPSAEQADSG